MRSRRLLIVVFLLLIVLVLGFLALQQFAGGDEAEVAEGDVTPTSEESPTPIPTPIPTQKILVAVQQLPRGFKITADSVGVREWPVTSVPANAYVIPEDVDPQVIIQQELVGKVVRSDIAIEQPVLRTLVVPDLTQIAAEGSDASAILPQGLVAVAMPVDRLSSVAYAIQDGDRVDLIMSFVLVDVDEKFQSILPNQIFPVIYPLSDPTTNEPITMAQVDGIVTVPCVSDVAAEGGSATDVSAIIAQLSQVISPCAIGRIETIPPGELANIVPSEPQRPRMVSQRTIESALVLHVGEFPLDGQFIALTDTPTPEPATATPVPEDGEEVAAEGEPAEAPTVTPTPTVPDIITLGITPQDAVVLTWAINSGVDINLALRSARDVPQVPTTSVTLQYMIETYNVTIPPSLPYSLEPSLRAIGLGAELATVTPSGQ